MLRPPQGNRSQARLRRDRGLIQLMPKKAPRQILTKGHEETLLCPPKLSAITQGIEALLWFPYLEATSHGTFSMGTLIRFAILLKI